jgi:hypothetical protein
MVTPSNQGKIRGKLESEAIKYTLNELRRFVDFFELSNENLGKMDKDSMKNIPERYIEECEGIAEGSGIDKNALLSLNFSPMLRQFFRDGCTAFTIPNGFTDDGSLLMLKNRDLVIRRMHPQVCSYSTLDGYNDFIGIVSAGNVTWYQGVNEKGLVVFNTAVPHQKYMDAMSIPIMIRRILEECDNVDEALRFVKNKDHNVGSNAFLGDNEKAVILEIKSGFPIHIQEVEKPECRTNRWIFHSNHDNSERSSILHRLQSETRLERGKQLLKGTQNFTMETLQRFSRDHEHGPGSYSICRHSSFTGSPIDKMMSSCTLSCQIFKVGTKVETSISLGQPCRTDFIHLDYGQEIPLSIASGRTWLEDSKSMKNN